MVTSTTKWSNVKFDKGWDRFMDILHPEKFRKRLNNNVGRAVRLNAKAAEAAMRKTLTNGMLPGQSGLQAYIKGSTKPGVDHADLFSAITSNKQKQIMTYFVGVLRTNENFNVAKIVHNGETINVTPKMRGMFFALWSVDKGYLSASKLTGRAAELYERRKGEWFPLKESTTEIIIPERPFVTITFQNQKLKSLILRNFTRASQLALSGKTKK